MERKPLHKRIRLFSFPFFFLLTRSGVVLKIFKTIINYPVYSLNPQRPSTIPKRVTNENKSGRSVITVPVPQVFIFFYKIIDFSFKYLKPFSIFILTTEEFFKIKSIKIPWTPDTGDI